jgi:hypothetical protein
MCRFLALPCLGMLLVLLFLACATFSPQARQAYESLQRLENRVHRAVWHQTYKSDLERAQKAVAAFLGTREAAKHPELAKAMEEALFDYELAGKVWEFLRLAGAANPSGGQRVCVKRQGNVGRLVLAWQQTHRPDLAQISSPTCAFDEMDISPMMPIIWEHAALRMKLLNRVMGP